MIRKINFLLGRPTFGATSALRSVHDSWCVPPPHRHLHDHYQRHQHHRPHAWHGPYHETMPQDASQASLPGAVLALNSDTLKLERQKLLRAQETERCLVQYWAGSRKRMDKSLWLIGVQTWCWWLFHVVSLFVCICIDSYRFTMIHCSSIGSHGNDFMPFLPELVWELLRDLILLRHLLGPRSFQTHGALIHQENGWTKRWRSNWRT